MFILPRFEEAIVNVAGEQAPCQIVVDRRGAMDSLEVVIEVTGKIFSLELQKQRSFLESVKKRISSVTGIGSVRKTGRSQQFAPAGGKDNPGSGQQAILINNIDMEPQKIIKVVD